MKGKLLFLCTDYYGLYKIFEEGFKKYSGCEVQTVLYKRYQYEKKSEKLLNFFSKNILRSDIKKVKASQRITAQLDAHYDHVFMICPDELLPKYLGEVTKRTENSAVYYWDGFDNFPKTIPTIKYFKRAFTFDPVDAKDYNINFITNFYFYEDRQKEYDYDLFFLATYDVRFPLIKKIAKALQEKGNKTDIRLYSPKKVELQEPLPNGITFIENPIPFDVTQEYMKKSRLILDIHKDIHRGLSFRIFEAMGLGKKLITTNPDVVNYDFYNPNNIFVWTDETEFLPADFLATPYEELPDDIYKKYSQENWVKTVLNIS